MFSDPDGVHDCQGSLLVNPEVSSKEARGSWTGNNMRVSLGVNQRKGRKGGTWTFEHEIW